MAETELVECLHYRVENPSAWPEGFDQAASDLFSEAVTALLSQASQIEALRKERDEASLCQQQIAAGSNQSATVARIIIAKNEADGRAEAAETKLAEAIKVIEPFAEIAPLVETTNRRDGERVHEQRRPDGTYHVLYRSHFRAARDFLDANGGGHAQ